MKKLLLGYVILSLIVIITLSILYGKCRNNCDSGTLKLGGEMSIDSEICRGAKDCGPCDTYRKPILSEDCYNVCMYSSTGAQDPTICENQCTEYTRKFDCPEEMNCCIDKCLEIYPQFSRDDCHFNCQNKYIEIEEGGKCSHQVDL